MSLISERLGQRRKLNNLIGIIGSEICAFRRPTGLAINLRPMRTKYSQLPCVAD